MKNLTVLFLIFLSFKISAKVFDLPHLDNSVRDLAQLYVPKNIKQKSKLPLIISLHGYKGKSSLQKNYIKLYKYVNRNDFMVLLPNGTKNSEGKRFWNASNFCCDFESSKIDDVAYIKSLVKLIDQGELYPNVDYSKIFVVGYSNGAFFANRLACEMDLDIAGIVTLSGTSDTRDKEGNLIPRGLSACDHEKSIKHLHIHGTKDKTIPYEGFDNTVTRKGHLSVDEYLNKWSLQNKCHVERKIKNKWFNANWLRFGFESKVYNWEGCEANLELIKVNKGGHFIIYKRRLVRKILDFLLKED